MDKIATSWSSEERSDLFRETAAQKGMMPAVIEKDFWVCWILRKLFMSDFFKGKILFKGGTSLSKVFGLINRFSEDIDLILKWDEITDEDPTQERSKTKQDQFNKQTIEKSRQYLKIVFLPEVEKLLKGVCTGSIPTTTPDVINVRYPSFFKEKYLLPDIHLEVGPLAAWMPNAEYEIAPYSAEEFPDLFKQPKARVQVIKAERTFWEKATILHQEAHRPQDKVQPSRYSRHYYDLTLMARSLIKLEAFHDIRLLYDVVAFKDKFYHCGWARYDLALPGTFKLVPPEYVLRSLAVDYKAMKIMIWGEAPEFDQIISEIEQLEMEINNLQETSINENG